MRRLFNKKGFTLMEIIVVLIIIAIMAAALIPSFVNFARNARANEYIAQARIGMSAAQAVVTQEAARGMDHAQLQQYINDAVAAGGIDPDWLKFRNNIVGDIANENGFRGILLSPNEGATVTYRVSNIVYFVRGAAGTTEATNPDWIIRINDNLNTTEFWRPGQISSSEGTVGRPTLANPNP